MPSVSRWGQSAHLHGDSGRLQGLSTRIRALEFSPKIFLTFIQRRVTLVWGHPQGDQHAFQRTQQLSRNHRRLHRPLDRCQRRPDARLDRSDRLYPRQSANRSGQPGHRDRGTGDEGGRDCWQQQQQWTTGIASFPPDAPTVYGHVCSRRPRGAHSRPGSSLMHGRPGPPPLLHAAPRRRRTPR